MNTKIKILAIISVASIIGFSSCQKENYTLGPFATPSDLTIVPTLKGQADTLPNGDGSGTVTFSITAKDAALYKVDFGDGSSPVITQNTTLTKTYSKQVGTFTYGVSVTAYGVAGSTPTVSKTDSVKVFYAYHVPAEILAMVTNNSTTGKRWVIDSTASGNVGLGPGDSYYPDWYSAAPGDKAGLGLYQNVYTFTENGIFVDSTYGQMFGNVNAFADDFNNGVTPPPGKFGGYGDDWTYYGPAYSTKYTFAGADDANVSTGVSIIFEKPGSVGYYLGTQVFQILEITDSTMWLRTPKTDWGQAWYVKLKAKK
ncbi:MAG: hypothetical protein JXR71_06225 [Bacteroidales bacterium]|nr:hypothetical protein [Bacteroidales bacterium]